jgi:hypothetical protein
MKIINSAQSDSAKVNNQPKNNIHGENKFSSAKSINILSQE